MIYQITHKTNYLYNGPVSYCHSKTWLKPRNLAYQKCSEILFDIDPLPAVFYEINDFYHNSVNYFCVQQTHDRLSVKVTSRVEVLPLETRAINAKHQMPWETVREMLAQFHQELVDVYHFKYESQHVLMDSEIFAYAQLSFQPKRPLLDATSELMTRIYKDFQFVTGYSTIATPLHEIMRNKKGVCQDFAHLAIACLRSHGLAAKYVSGYIETVPPLGKERLVGSDASHAWFSVYLPGEGWFDYDPTNNMIPSDQHITLAWGRDYADVTPMKSGNTKRWKTQTGGFCGRETDRVVPGLRLANG